jgi:hypothetical protein
VLASQPFDDYVLEVVYPLSRTVVKMPFAAQDRRTTCYVASPAVPIT